ncbi:Uncharacterised protein [Citrobacter koseri]|uniref:Uncharacterized protein n=1 Tax=Citrobacter koseri TaxID=545 RepID=A0A447UKL3_CITKO|nr:Uncharacterised protein [Citrobacter koseri]
MYMTTRMMLRNTSLSSIRMTVGVFKPLIFPIGITPT